MIGIASAVRIGVLYAIVPAFVGSLLHELTHALAVKATGQTLHGMNLHRLFSNKRASVLYEVTGDERWRWVIGLAPLVIGSAALAIFHYSGGRWVGPTGLAMAIGWSFYTLQLSREDVTGKAHESDREAKAMEGLFLALLGWAVLSVEFGLSLAGPMQFMGYVLFGAGLGLATWNVAWQVKAKQIDEAPAQSRA